ncbi:ABC transporter permease subunit [Bacillus salitolerans]|uniref:ABC transporter permease subunit n=1 Tax=Bacillus salitolerans TaxID=1437434 RepID=A0ABW4LUM9_9BACI
MVRKKLTKSFLQFVLALIGIFCLGAFPYLFFDLEMREKIYKIQVLLDSGKLRNTLFLYQSITFNVQDYFHSIKLTIHEFIHYSEMTYIDIRNSERPLFPFFNELYVNSLKYLSLSILVSFVSSIIFTYSIMLLPVKIKKRIKMCFFILESLPDLFVILSLQSLVIWMYKKTGILLFQTVSTFGDEAFMIPLLVLSFLPTVYMTRYLLLSFEDEYESLYVELARGKGLTKLELLVKHIFRNAFASFIFHFKTIFWFTISNLLMIEIILNINGFFRFIYVNSARNPELLTLCMLFMFVPFFLIMTLLESMVGRISLKGVDES